MARRAAMSAARPSVDTYRPNRAAQLRDGPLVHIDNYNAFDSADEDRLARKLGFGLASH